jgi:hypothetical protein
MRQKKPFNIRDSRIRVKKAKEQIAEIVKSEFVKKHIQSFGGDDTPRLSRVNHSFFITYYLSEFIHYVSRKGYSLNKFDRASYVEAGLIRKIDSILAVVEAEVGFKIDLDDLIPKQKYKKMSEEEIKEIDERDRKIRLIIPVIEKGLF